ncbi:hypothetical protein [Streptomyces sp. NPDC088725]|uniref:hypothetical protein n=1 Tax=Streptomyces sp. NPDC088725 TaxID=3365873 RepID=UPI0037F55945
MRPSRRRGRTTLIITAAALLGLVGGTSVGYGVQAERPPTPAAALSQPALAYPASAAKGKAGEPAAGGARPFKTDGDLRRLLLGKPAGARDTEPEASVDGWSPLQVYAEGADSAAGMFGYLAGLDFRRVASTAWDSGADRTTYIDLVQFRAGSELNAVEYARDQTGFMLDHQDAEAEPLKGSGNGRCWVYEAPAKAGYLPLHEARALAQRGDVVLSIEIFDAKPISMKDIRTLAERQLERL